MNSTDKNIIIIGSGIGGLASACLLADAGYKVEIYESRDQIGGRAGSLTAGGFTFDTGPSWYLMPEVYDRFFSLLGQKTADYYTLTKLAPAYQVFFESQTQPTVITGDETTDAATFEAIEPGAGKKLAAYLDSAGDTYRLSLKHFLYTTFPLKDMMKPDILRAGPKMAAAAGQSIDSFVGKFFTDLRLKQILEYPAVFLGSSPFTAPAIYHLMSYLDFRQGVFYPQGGLYEIVRALERMAAERGVTILTGSPVKHIDVQDGTVTGISLQDGRTVTADHVISNADLHHTQTALLDTADQDYPEKYWRHKEAGPSALLLYLGIRGALPQLQHHNLFFAKQWQANFKAIFKDKTWPSPASIYVCKPSATDTTVAPAGHENIFVLVPLPADTGISDQQIADYSEAYIEQISLMAKIPDLKQRIVYRKSYSPKDFEHDLNAWQGTALGLSHRLTQSAMFRPRTKSKKVKGLYFVGGNVQPGVGIPMCLISAELVASQIIGRPLAPKVRGAA